MDVNQWISIGALVIVALAGILYFFLALRRSVSLKGFELKFPGVAMRAQELIVKPDKDKT